MPAFDEAVEERRSVTGIALSWLHVVIILIVYLLTIGVIYGELRSQTNENTRRIQTLEDHQVNREQMKEFEEDTQRRLQRIEDKLDRDRAIRELH